MRPGVYVLENLVDRCLLLFLLFLALFSALGIGQGLFRVRALKQVENVSKVETLDDGRKMVENVFWIANQEDLFVSGQSVTKFDMFSASGPRSFGRSRKEYHRIGGIQISQVDFSVSGLVIPSVGPIDPFASHTVASSLKFFSMLSHLRMGAVVRCQINLHSATNIASARARRQGPAVLETAEESANI